MLFTIEGFAQSYWKNEIENEKQSDFPGIAINGQVVSDLYSISLEESESKYTFVKSSSLNQGTLLKINSYIVSKEILDYLNLNTVASKTNREELKQVLISKDAKKFSEYILKLAEKTRPASNDKEVALVLKEIKKNKTQDDPNQTNFFKTGYIEVSPIDDSDIRYFVPLDKIKSLSIDSEHGKIKLAQAMTLLSFKKLKSNINYGYFSDEDIKTFEQIEETLTSHCNQDCIMKGTASDLVTTVIDVVNHDFLSELDPEVVNTKSLLGQACLIFTYAKFCGGNPLSEQNSKLLSSPQLKKLLSKFDGSLDQACASIQK